MLRIQAVLVTALGAAALATTAPAAFAVRAPAPVVHAEFDARSGEQADVPAATTTARRTLRRDLGPQAAFADDPVTGGLRSVGRTDGFLTGRSSSDPETIGLGYVRAHAAAFGLDAGDLAQLQPATRSTSPDGITHLTWRQLDNGVPAYDSALFANVAADGRLINVGGSPTHDLAPPATDPPLGPGAARAAAQRDLGVPTDNATADIGTDPARTTTFSTGDTATLVTLADPDGDHLAWKLIVDGIDPYLYEVLVDAATGAVLTRHSLTDFASNASVVNLHPGAPGDATPHTVDLAPWLTTPITGLVGPNVHAYADAHDPNGIGGDAETPPNLGTTDFVYPTASVTPASGRTCPTIFAPHCTWDGTARDSATVNANQVTTQLFYFVNRYHDWLAQDPIGFTTGSYNFQGDDPVKAEADDSGGLNNANFATPPDDQSPTMQMYLFTSPFPAINGADDASIVDHEYTHGLTNRLVGGDGQANGLQTRQSRAMGEGWSDWYSLDFLVDQGYMADSPATAGDVVEGAYPTNNALTGIRENAVDCPVGSTSAHCPGTPTAGSGGFTFADMGRIGASNGNPYFEVHNEGEIWSETLWDLRDAVGSVTARALVTGGLRLSPKQPSFLQMRDAILQADLATGGTHRATIWQVFATRGMGYGATTTSGNAGRGTPSFIVPPAAVAGAPAVTSPPPLGDGDATLEPGEAARVQIPITNPGSTPLTNVRATLTTTTAGVVVGHATTSYGTIAPGAPANAAEPFAITVPATVPCATVVGLTITATSDQGPLLTTTVSVPLGSGATSNTTGPISIPILDDRIDAPAISTLTIPSAGRVGHLRVTLTVDHTFVGDLHGWLTSPSGTMVNLFEDIGDGSTAGSAGLSAVVLDDSAASSIQDVPYGALPAITGTYSPDEPLGALKDENRAGTWTLRVTDDYPGDSGSVKAWSLSTDQPTCAATGPALPAVATGGPSAVTAGSATLNGMIGATGTATQGAFEYGTTTAYGTVTPAAGADGPISQPIGGLTAGTTYHYRALAVRAGTVAGAGDDQAFIAGDAVPATPVTPPASTTPTPPAGPPPPPTKPPVVKLKLTGPPSSAALDAQGRLTIAFTLPDTKAKAKGTVALVTASPLRLGKSKKQQIVTVGHASFTVSAKHKVGVRITLTKDARAYVRSHGALRVKATIKVGTATTTITFIIKKAKHKH
ncbi:MAG TPA: M36 family metallopeptidase [Baekduia sp.]